MPRFSILTLFIVLAVTLSACGTATPAALAPSPDAYTSANLITTYENALPARMQLSLGTLKLAETSTPITGRVEE